MIERQARIVPRLGAPNAGTGSEEARATTPSCSRPGTAPTTILDFTDGDDTIDLSALTGITAFSDLTSQGGGTVRLDDTAVTDLDANDFTFYDDGM